MGVDVDDGIVLGPIVLRRHVVQRDCSRLLFGFRWTSWMADSPRSVHTVHSTVVVVRTRQH